jgi:hypothetical protein
MVGAERTVGFVVAKQSSGAGTGQRILRRQLDRPLSGLANRESAR